MSIIRFWAIRHAPTGHYLPEPAGRMGRGGSHVEPVAVSDADRARLFPSKIAASRALGAWLRGKVHHSSGYDSFSGEYWETNELRPVPSRKRDEMDIVEIEVVLP